MSDKYKKVSFETKNAPSVITKDPPKNNNNNGAILMKNSFTSKRDNITFSQKNKMAQSINILNVVKKLNEKVKTKKKE